MKLYIVRHGETNENARGIVQGWLDTGLNTKGLAQAKQVAADFDKPIDAIYSSDLKRAVATAAAFRVHYPDTPYFEDTRLRERKFGDAQGTRRDTLNWEQVWSAKDPAIIPNAETIDEFTTRVKDFLNDIKLQQYESILVVAHGGVLNRVQFILNPHHAEYPHANASILEIDI